MLGEPRGSPSELRDCCLRPAAASCGRTTGHPAGAVVAEICLLRASARVGIGQAQRRTLPFADFRTAAVTDEHCLTGHLFPFVKDVFGSSLTKNAR